MTSVKKISVYLIERNFYFYGLIHTYDAYYSSDYIAIFGEWQTFD